VALPFAFYERLTRNQQRVYRQSDGVARVDIPRVSDLRSVVDTVQHALADSFHTEGFYQRESSLLRQLLPPAPDTMARPDA
jgi:hypothetical protein